MINWGQVALGALGQGAISAAVAELTGGDAGQMFLLTFAMAMARAVATEMHYSEARDSAATVICDQNKECVPNLTVGRNGEIQLGGTRIDPQRMCDGQTDCSVALLTDTAGNNYWSYTAGTLPGIDAEVSLANAILTASGCGPLTMGCSQSGTNGMFFGFEYDKEGTGLWDRFVNEVVEAFGGVHDFLNHYIGFGYGEDGFTYQNPSFGRGLWTDVMNVINIPLSSPLAFNNMVTPEMAVWLQDYYDSLGKK